MTELMPASSLEEAERHELSRLLTLPEISRSTNLVRLLSFVCERYFEGRVADIRESTIAVQALGRRKDDFDSQADPIVRVTARTLRKRLEDFYRNEGRGHSVQLFLPTGQYVPRFVHRAEPPAGGADGPASEAPPVAEGGAPDRAVPGTPARRPGLVSRLAAFPAWRRRSTALAAVAAGILSFLVGRWTAPSAGSPPGPLPGPIWGEPVWSDEFGGPRGAPPDPARWSFDVGNRDGWGNDELEVYCRPGSETPPPCDPRTPNVYQDGEGHLVIQARRTPEGTWTSGRIKTQGLREFLYGRIEARLRLPVGTGLWSSFWALGADIDDVGWPDSGSFSLVENVPERPGANGLGPSMVRSTLHGPGYFGGNGMWQNFLLPGGGRVDDAGDHVYGAIWSPDMIQFYVDDPDNVFFVRTAADVPAGGRWVFDHPVFLVLNLAVGGQWPGPPDATTPSPSPMRVDYVRVHQAAPLPAPAMSAEPIRVAQGHAGSSILTLASAAGGIGRVTLSCSGAPANSSCSLNTSVVDLTNAPTQVVTLTLHTRSGSARDPVSPRGRYALRVTSRTVSGDSGTVEIPVTID